MSEHVTASSPTPRGHRGLRAGRPRSAVVTAALQRGKSVSTANLSLARELQTRLATMRRELFYRDAVLKRQIDSLKIELSDRKRELEDMESEKRSSHSRMSTLAAERPPHPPAAAASEKTILSRRVSRKRFLIILILKVWHKFNLISCRFVKTAFTTQFNTWWNSSRFTPVNWLDSRLVRRYRVTAAFSAVHASA